MIKRSELDEIVSRVRLNDEMIGRLQFHGRPEIGEGKGDRAAEIDVARVSEKSHPCVSLVLDYRGRGGAIRIFHGRLSFSDRRLVYLPLRPAAFICFGNVSAHH